MKKILELNFKVDEPTVNGNIYPRKILQESLTEFVTMKPLPAITLDCSKSIDGIRKPVVHVSDIAAKCEDFEIKEDNKILIHLETDNMPQGEVLEKILEDVPDQKLTTMGIGSTEDKIVGDYKIISLFLENPETKLAREEKDEE